MKVIWLFVFVVVAIFLAHQVQAKILTQGDINKGKKDANLELEKRTEIEAEMLELEEVPELDPTDPRVAPEYILAFMQVVCKKNHCTREDVEEFTNIDLADANCDFEQNCLPQDTVCSETSMTYRNFDGSCNNLLPQRELYGKVDTPLGRFLPPDYDDLITTRRVRSASGGDLTEPRIITDTVFKALMEHKLDCGLTSSTVFFGQALSHDTADTAGSRIAIDGSSLACCENNEITEAGEQHPNCMPIRIQPSDSFYPTVNVSCLNLRRSAAALNHNCTFDYRQQTNRVTHLLDGSFVYSNDDSAAIALRTLTDGKLLTSDGNLLPLNERNGCTSETQDCRFRTGDRRGNQNSPLAFMHTLLVREHNRIAAAAKIHLGISDDEILFQETRKVVIGILQSITFREYLPLIIGPDAISEFDLEIGDSPDPNVYNPYEIPEIKNGFTTAAFRFGHGTVNSDVSIVFDNETSTSRTFESTFGTPFDLYTPSLFDGIGRGLITQCPRQASVDIATALTQQLYNGGAQAPFGSDLASRNILRGRDHGLPPFNTFREWCGSPKINQFSDFNISSDLQMKLENVYESVEDLDLFVGGLLEDIVPDGSVGRTFACIMGKQFEILMKADRFFYTNGETEEPNKTGHEYSEAQIMQFNKASFARLMCDNVPGISSIAPRAFERKSDISNPLTACAALPEVDLSVMFA